MMTRRLHDRAREHLTAAKQRSSTAALGEHYAESHPNAAPNIQFKVITHHQDSLRLHIEEALTIKKHAPTLNCKQEDLGQDSFHNSAQMNKALTPHHTIQQYKITQEQSLFSFSAQ